MMSHNHTFTICSVLSKPSSKKFQSKGKPIALLHIFAVTVLYILMNNCDSSIGLRPQEIQIQTLMTVCKATASNRHMLHTDCN